MPMPSQQKKSKRFAEEHLTIKNVLGITKVTFSKNKAKILL